MPRFLLPLCLSALGLAGCTSPDPDVRLVPISTVFPVAPQPATTREFRDAEAQGCSVVATGRGWAYGPDDAPIHLHAGERLHVIRVDARTGEVLVRRLDYPEITYPGLARLTGLARISPDGLETRATTFPG